MSEDWILIENLVIGAGLAVVAGVLSRLHAGPATAVVPADELAASSSLRMMALAVNESGGFSIRPVSEEESVRSR